MKLSLAENDKVNSYNVNVEIKSVSDPQAQPHFLTNGKWLKPLATEEEIRNNAYGTQLWDR